MNSSSKVFGILSVAIAGLIFSSQTAGAATTAGQVQFTYGNVNVTTQAGETHAIKKGDVINEGDTVITAITASAQIKMKDGGFIAVRPNTNLKFDKFVFHGKEDGEERSFFSLFKGGFRAVTGFIGKQHKQNYKITTTTATIGVRGTDHETYYVPEGNPLAPAGAYSKVNVGETTMTTNRGTVNVLPNQMGYAGNINEVPKVVPINTNLFTVSAAPSKTIKQSKAEQSNQPVAQGQADKTAAGGQSGGSQNSSSTGSTGENTAVGNSANTSTSSNTGDPNTLRADTTGGGALSANITTVSPSPTSIQTINAPQLIVPIILTNAANGFTLNATSQTNTQGGVSTTLTGATIFSTAYNANHVAVETTNNYSGGALIDPANLHYVAGGSSSSGALSSYTQLDIGGGANRTDIYAITGGTASSFNAPSFGLTGIQYGNWAGYTAQTFTSSFNLGGNNGGGQTNWMWGLQGYLDSAYSSGTSGIGAMSGTFNYSLTGNNAPRYQNSGTAGTLNSASITANFTSMTVSASLGLNIGADYWGASLTNQTITSVVGGPFNGFATSGGTSNTMTVTHGVGSATYCPTCSGNLNGMFTGQNFSGAMLAYNLSDTTTATSVYGDAAFNRQGSVTANAPAPTGMTVVECGSGCLTTYSATGIVTSAANVLTQYGSGTTSNANSVTVNCPACTASSTSAGIYYGTWTSGTYTSTSTNTSTVSTAPAYWITGPEAGPLYLPQALIGTASYALDAGQVSNYAGVAGTVNGTTSLAVNFTKQTVGINLNATVAGHTWNASTVASNEAPLMGNQGIGGAAFYASTASTGGMGYSSGNSNNSGVLSISVDGVASTLAYGNINGQLTGSGLTGAIINFSLYGSFATSPYYDSISGVAAFTGTAQNTNSPYRYVSVSTYDTVALEPILGFYANNPNRVTQDTSGNLTQFDSQSVATSNSNANVTITNTGSSLTDQGSDPVTGISWGRWTGGTLNVLNRATGITTSSALAGSLHWIAEPVSTAPVTLPVSGTYAYTYAGGTQPTDNMGHVGTLNSASVTANFTAQTVSLGVNATVAGATLNATAPSAPIIQNTVFYASSQEPSASTSHLNVACTGSCNGTTGGTVIGKFSGAGATGVAMTYGLQNGTSVVSGVAAFHR